MSDTTHFPNPILDRQFKRGHGRTISSERHPAEQLKTRRSMACRQLNHHPTRQFSRTPSQALCNRRLICLLCLMCCYHGNKAFAQDSLIISRRQNSNDSTRLISAAHQLKINHALEYLVQNQHEDGSFGSGTIFKRNVAVTGLCGMALLSAGSTPGRGPYGVAVHKTVDFLISRAQSTGMIIDDDSKSQGPMYGHGFATLFLAEVYGMSSKPKKLRAVLKPAVELIIKSQHKTGGWRYFPNSQDADVSVTVCEMMALRAARNAGFTIPKNTIENAEAYVKKCQNKDGGFRYMLDRKDESLFPRSAAAVVALNSVGVYDGHEIDNALNYLSRFRPNGQSFKAGDNYYYGHYYAVQVMWQRGGNLWQKWYPAIRDELLDNQLANGSWPSTSVCPEYATAMSCLILQIPNNYLPIFQR